MPAHVLSPSAPHGRSTRWVIRRCIAKEDEVRWRMEAAFRPQAAKGLKDRCLVLMTIITGNRREDRAIGIDAGIVQQRR